MVPAKDFKRRMVVEIDGSPHMIEQIQVQTPSARGAATLYKIKGATSRPRSESTNRTVAPMRSTSRASSAGRSSIFTEITTRFTSWTRHHSISSRCRSRSCDQAEFMTENMEGVEALVVDDEVIAIELPDTVELPIIETAPESAATRRPGAPSRPRCRRVSWSRSQSTLTRGRPSGSTPGQESIWDGPIRRLIIAHRFNIYKSAIRKSERKTRNKTPIGER